MRQAVIISPHCPRKELRPLFGSAAKELAEDNADDRADADADQVGDDEPDDSELQFVRGQAAGLFELADDGNGGWGRNHGGRFGNRDSAGVDAGIGDSQSPLRQIAAAAAASQFAHGHFGDVVHAGIGVLVAVDRRGRDVQRGGLAIGSIIGLSLAAHGASRSPTSAAD